MRPRIILLALLPLAALVIAGCGGSGGEGSTTTAATVTPTTTALSKAELIAQGDAICAEVNAAVGTVGETETEVAARIGQEADLYSGMVERLKGLGTPQEAAGYPEFTAAADELAKAESDAKLAAERGEEGNLAAAQSEASAALTSFQGAASSYGFEDCSEEPSPPSVSAAGTNGAGEEEEGGVEEAAPEVEVEAEAAPEEAAPEEVAPEEGGAGGTAEGGGTATGGGGESGGGSGGIGPG